METNAGPRMRVVVRYVAAHPGCSKGDAARGGESGPLYASSVQRAVLRGFIREDRDKGRPGSGCRLFVTDAGREFAEGRLNLPGTPRPGGLCAPGTPRPPRSEHGEPQLG